MYNEFSEIIYIDKLPNIRTSYYKSVFKGYVVEFNWRKYKCFFQNLNTAVTFMYSCRDAYGISSCGLMRGLVEKSHSFKSEKLYIENNNCEEILDTKRHFKEDLIRLKYIRG